MKTITQRKSSLKHKFQQSKARCRILHCDDLYRNGDDGEKEREQAKERRDQLCVTFQSEQGRLS